MAKTKSSHLRITTWPGGRVPTPAVYVRPDIRVVDGEYLRFGWEPEPPVTRYEVPPDDLYLYELADLDLADVEAVAALCREHGAIASWWGFDDLGPGNWERSIAQHAREYGRCYEQPNDLVTVHVDHYTYRVRMLRRLTEHVLAYRDGKPAVTAWPALTDDTSAWERFVALVNAALEPFHVRMEVDLGNPDLDLGVPRPSLYEVAVLQLVNDLGEDGAVYKTCAAEGCGRRFLRQRGRSQHYSRSTGVTYCSPSCANAQAQREWRRRQRDNKKGAGR